MVCVLHAASLVHTLTPPPPPSPPGRSSPPPVSSSLTMCNVSRRLPSFHPQVKLVMQDGPGKQYTTVPLPCQSTGDAAWALAGPGSCTVPAFLAFLQGKALTQAQWCTACANIQVREEGGEENWGEERMQQAALASQPQTSLSPHLRYMPHPSTPHQVDYCSAASLQAALAAQQAASCSSGRPTWQVVVAAVVSGIGMLLLCMLGLLLLTKRDDWFRDSSKFGKPQGGQASPPTTPSGGAPSRVHLQLDI